MRNLLVAIVSLIFITCASKPPIVPQVPDWAVVPPDVMEALCTKLRSDAIATGELTIVRVTQPLATPDILSAVSAATPGRHRPVPGGAMRIVHKALPLTLSGSTCQWRPVDVRQQQRSDEVVVELSAPLTNPYLYTEAGMLVRVTLGEEHSSWYWISLLTNGQQWAPKFVSVLPK